jgi:hypothetical protein
MTPDDWREIAATSTTLPDVEWDVFFRNGEQTQGRLTHLPSGPPEEWANDALFHIEQPGVISEVGAPRRIDQVVRCVPRGPDSADTNESSDEEDTDTEGLRKKLEEAKRDVEELGGWAAFKSGDWLLNLVRKSFSNYYRRASDEYFRKKYPGKNSEFIAKKLISVAARNSSIVGALTGAAVTTDELGRSQGSPGSIWPRECGNATNPSFSRSVRKLCKLTMWTTERARSHGRQATGIKIAAGLVLEGCASEEARTQCAQTRSCTRSRYRERNRASWWTAQTKQKCSVTRSMAKDLG